MPTAKRAATARQLQIMELDKAGKSPAEIAAALSISTNGVYNHLRRMGRGRGAKRAARKRAPNTRGKTAVAPPHIKAIPAERRAAGIAALNGSDRIENIRSAIADSLEHLQIEIGMKKNEVVGLQAEYDVLKKAFTAFERVAK